MPVVNQRRDVRQQAGQVLVAHRAKHRMGLRKVAHLVQVVGQRRHRLRVVRHVQHQGRLARDDLEAARQLHHRQPVAHRLGVDRQLLAQRLEHRQHTSRVDQLVGAAQCRIGQAVESLVAAAPGPLLLVTLEVVVAAQPPQISAHLIGTRLQRCRRLRVADHHRAAGPHDAGLLAPDGLSGIPKVLGVVQRNAGDQRTVGVHRVDGVQPPAHAHLQNHQVQLGCRQCPHDGQRGELEPGQRDLAAGHLNRCEVRQQRLGAGHVAVDAAALFKVHQVRLDVEPHPVAGLQRHRLQHRAGRAFAVGAGHADHRHTKAQVEPVAHRDHPVQRHVDGHGMQLLAVGEPASQGGGMRHGL